MGEDMDFVKDYPTKAFQLKWIECYLTKFDGGIKPSESRLMTFYENVNKFSLCYHMMWGMWGLVQSQISKIEFCNMISADLFYIYIKICIEEIIYINFSTLKL